MSAYAFLVLFPTSIFVTLHLFKTIIMSHGEYITGQQEKAQITGIAINSGIVVVSFTWLLTTAAGLLMTGLIT